LALAIRLIASGIGAFVSNYVDPADDPKNAGKK
jgi:hypothetical protein